ncbi:MAG TPA: hypothetical protein VGM53_11590 [Streptosporangiaceae bacterium]
MMAQAHQAWRASLRAVTVSQLVDRVPRAVRERERARILALRAG